MSDLAFVFLTLCLSIVIITKDYLRFLTNQQLTQHPFLGFFTMPKITIPLNSAPQQIVLPATVLDNNGNVMVDTNNVPLTITEAVYSADDETVAKVDPTSGVITPVSVGECNIEMAGNLGTLPAEGLITVEVTAVLVDLTVTPVTAPAPAAQ